MKVLHWLTLGATAMVLGASRGPAQSASAPLTPLLAAASSTAALPATEPDPGTGVGCNPCIEIVLKCDDAVSGSGIPLIGRVKNCGDVDLQNVVVSHDNATANPGDDVVVLTLPSLAPGEQEIFSGSYQPSVAPGQLSTVVVTGVGTPPPSCGSGPVSGNQSATCLASCSPCLEVILKCTDAAEGEGIPFFGRVTNCGNVDMTNVVVAHDNGTPVDTSDDVVVLAVPLLAPGAKQGFSGTYSPSVPPGEASTLVASAVGTPPADCSLQDVSASQSTTCESSCSPCMEVVLKCNDAQTAGPIPFFGRVKNCGDVDLVNIQVKHDNGTPDDPSDDVVILTVPSLAPSKVAGFAGDYQPSVPPGEPSTLTATAVGSPADVCELEDITASGSATCTSSCSPCMDVVVKCNDAPAGSPIQFFGRVKNCGNVDLLNVMVAHDNGTPGFTGDDVFLVAVPVLPPGELQGFTGSYLPSVPVGTPSTLTVTAVATPPKACGGGDLSASGTATCSQLPGSGDEGCTPGFWKNHPELWDEASDPIATAAAFTTSTGFNAFFGLTAAESGFPDTLTMLGAVQQGGGGPNKLGRHGVSALLNLAAGLDYDMPDGVTTVADLVAAIKNAYVTDVFEPLATQIAEGNEGDCPF